jgi:hypothetical protein
MKVVRPRYDDVVRRLVRRLRAEPSPSLPGDRRRLVAAVEQALHARARRQLHARRALAVLASAAAALALYAGVRVAGRTDAPTTAGAHRPHALTVLAAATEGAGEVIEGDRAPRPLRSGMALGAGLRLLAPAAGEVRVGASEGASLALEQRGELTVTEASETQRFALRSGAVRAHVSRLFAGERFVIDTQDATIEARDASFRVAIVPATEGCAGTTRVTVSEGTVGVTAGGREVRVTREGHWPSDCDRLAATTPRAVAARDESPRRHASRVAPAPAERPARAAPPPTAAPSSSPAASELAAANDLFAAAVRAKNGGRPAEAERLLTRLIEEHPHGPLVESAAVQRMKVLTGLDAQRAQRAAAEYLARFPAGFARADAQRLLDRASP